MCVALFRILNSKVKVRCYTITMTVQPSSDMAKFRQDLKSAKEVVILTGAGISAESGIPTFRGSGGYWRIYKATSLASIKAFEQSPSLVWEFYHYRREVAAKAHPNAGHSAIAQYEARHEGTKKVTVITQNVDGLHMRAGTKNLLELHGSLYKTRCTECNEVLVNTDSPICPGLANKGAPDENLSVSDVSIADLPHCKKCQGLLRPHIVWFGERLEHTVLEQVDKAMDTCDVCIVAGTSSVVYPAAFYAPMAALRGATVAEFNLEKTPETHRFKYHFSGPCGTMLPQALAD